MSTYASPSGCSSATLAQPSSIIDSAMDEVEKEISSLHEIFHALQSRLTPVSQERLAETNKDSQAFPSCGVPLADKLHRFARDVGAARSRIRDTIDSLAV